MRPAIATDDQTPSRRCPNGLARPYGLGSVTIWRGIAAHSANPTCARRETLHEGTWVTEGASQEVAFGSMSASVQLHAVVEREIRGIRYSYTLYERGAKPGWALWRPNGDIYPLFVRLEAPLMRPQANNRRQPGGSSSVGRASAFQAECRGFETRLPLQFPVRAQHDTQPVKLGRYNCESTDRVAHGRYGSADVTRALPSSRTCQAHWGPATESRRQHPGNSKRSVGAQRLEYGFR